MENGAWIRHRGVWRGEPPLSRQKGREAYVGDDDGSTVGGGGGGSGGAGGGSGAAMASTTD